MKKILLALSLCTLIVDDSFTATPGSKARGMAGAFTAILNNNFAMPWFMLRTAYSQSDIGRVSGDNWSNEIIS